MAQDEIQAAELTTNMYMRYSLPSQGQGSPNSNEVDIRLLCKVLVVVICICIYSHPTKIHAC